VQGASRTPGLYLAMFDHMSHMCSLVYSDCPCRLQATRIVETVAGSCLPSRQGHFFVALVFLVLCWQLCAVLCLCKVSIFYLCNLISETVSYTRVYIEPYKTTSLVQLTMPHLVSSIPSKLKLRPDITCVSEFPIVFVGTPGQNSSN